MAKIDCVNISLKAADRAILKNVSFQADKGLTCIAGENGAGKSMLLKCILSSVKFEGDVLLNGRSIKGNKKEIFKNIGYIPSFPRAGIIGENGLEDVLFSISSISKKPKDEAKKEALSILKKMNAEHLLYAKTDFMSDGELRKISICSSLALQRDVILADEPFNGLDYKGTLLLIDTFLMLKSMGKCVLIVSHNLDRFLYYVDSLVILKNGEVVKQDLPCNALDDLEKNGIHRPFGKFEEMKWL